MHMHMLAARLVVEAVLQVVPQQQHQQRLGAVPVVAQHAGAVQRQQRGAHLRGHGVGGDMCVSVRVCSRINCAAASKASIGARVCGAQEQAAALLTT